MLARRCRIDLSELNCDDNRVPFKRFVTLVREAKEVCGDPALALHFGEAMDMSEMSLVGRIGSEAGTIGDDIRVLNRYSPLALEVDGGERFCIERIGRQLGLSTRARIRTSFLSSPKRYSRAQSAECAESLAS